MSERKGLFKLIHLGIAAIVGGALMTFFGWSKGAGGEPAYPVGAWAGPVTIVLGVALLFFVVRDGRRGTEDDSKDQVGEVVWVVKALDRVV